ncbi:MAG: hypothetical protein ISS25_03395 [Nanoarchaeota archaeon]|nr:hypothetical protein [DPANN group archaeon]MBL7116846.1 hypothetical protein [Nanoarchaeota archaeon]
MKDYSDYSLSSEGGRASYFAFNYLIIKTYMYRTKFPIFPRVFSISNNNIARWFYIVKKGEAFEKELDGYVNNIALLDEAETIMKNLAREAKNKLDCKLSDLTTEDFIDHYQLFCKHFMDLVYFAGSIRSADKGLMPRLKKILTPEEIGIVSLPPKNLFIVREELALRELAVKLFKEEREPGKNDVLDVHSRFLWSSLGYYNEKPKTKEEYVQVLKNMIEDDPVGKINYLKNRLEKEKETQQKLLEKYDEPVLKVASAFVYLKDLYKESINKAILYSDDLFKEIARRTDKSEEFIKKLTQEETVDLLKGIQPNENLIKERIQHSVIICDHQRLTILSGKDANKFEKDYLVKLYAKEKEFKGRTASRGYGKGRVKVVLSVDDFGKVEQGDILTVMNTSPEFVPIMKKASAIIAEDGALSSHVSVISREFGIPCVVGIDVITSILKDGDLVEVDADKGVIKKLFKE